MRRWVLFLLSCAAAAQTNISVTPGPLTAILEFDAPDPVEDCTVDVTFETLADGSPDWTKPLPWSDRSLYPSFSVIPKGDLHRRKVIGEWNLRIAANGFTKEHMMLPSGNKIYGRVACGERSAVAFDFRTPVYPQGFTWQPKRWTNPTTGVQMTPTAHFDVPKHQIVNRFGNIEMRIQEPTQITAFGQFTPNLAWDTPAADAVPLGGGGSWTLTSQAHLYTDSNYQVYDGSDQEKLYVPISFPLTAWHLVDFIRITVVGCSGSDAPVEVSMCRTDNGTSCSHSNHKKVTLPAGSTNSCTNGGASFNVPPDPVRYDAWQDEMWASQPAAGILLWVSSTGHQRALINTIQSLHGQSTQIGASFGGYTHYFSPKPYKLDGVHPRYIGMVPGWQGYYPSFWAYDPAAKEMHFIGLGYLAGDHPWGVPTNTMPWSEAAGHENSFYTVSNDGDLEQIYMTGDGSEVPPNTFAAMTRKKLLLNVRGALSDFFNANREKYGMIRDLTKVPCNPWPEEVTWMPASGQTPFLEYLTLSCRVAGQDSWQWVFTIQIESGKAAWESPYTKVYGLFIPQQSDSVMSATIHSVFAGRGRKPVVVMTAASAKDGSPAAPMRVNVVQKLNPGDTTLVVTSPCGASSEYWPCDPYSGMWISGIREGNMFRLDGSNPECVYVNSATLDPNTHNWTLKVSRDHCTNGESYPTDFNQGYYYYGQKTWNVGASASMMQSWLGRPRNVGIGYLVRPYWDQIRDPYGQRTGGSNYYSTYHDYCAMNYIGGGEARVMKSSPGTSACEDEQEKGSNIFVPWKTSKWAGGRTICDGNACETHPSHAQDDAKGVDRDYEIDGLPFLGGAGWYTQVSKETSTGQANLYRLNSMTGPDSKAYHPNYKASSFAWFRGYDPLRDISGPGSTIDDSKPLTFCYAYRAGECIPTSKQGEVFGVLPGLNHTSCMGGEFTRFADDTCAMNITSSFDAISQIGFIRLGLGTAGDAGEGTVATSSFRGGDHTRPISDYDIAYRMKSSGWNARTTPDGSALFFSSARGGRNMATITKMPPFGIWDAKRRDQPVNFDVRIQVPPGLSAANNAVVEFGYNLQLYCVGQQTDTAWDGRSETCVKGNQPIEWYNQDTRTLVSSQPGKNFDFAGDAVTGVPCTTNCTVTIPVIPVRTFYYRYKLRDVNNNVLFTSHACSSDQDCMIGIVP